MRRKLGVALPTVIALLCTLLYAAPASAGQTFSYTAAWQGYAYALTPVANVVVASYADARLVGQVTNFQTTSKKESCLNGLAINAYTAPAEFPGLYVANDDSQGAMCALGTWTFPIYAYTASWLGYPSFSLNLIPNVEVESFADSSLVGKVANLQTQDAHFSCLDGQSLNVYTAPNEFPGLYLVHVIAGTACTPTADTWTFPIFSYTGSWNGASYSLTLLPNNEVQTAFDAKLITFRNTATCNVAGLPPCGSPVQLQNFQTADPNFACLRGSSINVWMAQTEFQGKHIAHVIGGTMCAGFGATWTFLPVTHYKITLKSYIPQAQLWDPGTSSLCSLLVVGSITSAFSNQCPYLTYSSENTVFGTSSNDPGVPGCYTPFDPFDTTVVGVFGGDNHTGYDGSFRTQTVIDFDWDPASRTIKNFTTKMEHGVSSVTLDYYWFGQHVGGPCTITNQAGLQYPFSGPTSNTTFTTGTSGWDPFIPGETNPLLCSLYWFASCGPFGDVIDATLKGSFNSDGSLSLPSVMTDWYPSYGVEVWPNESYDAPQYRQTVVNESWANTMSPGGLIYVGYALKYYSAMTGKCTPTPDPLGVIPMNYCINWTNFFDPAP